MFPAIGPAFLAGRDRPGFETLEVNGIEKKPSQRKDSFT
jgi:hypothetical protein